MKIAIILGTRPEIIKLSPIIRECQKRGPDYFIIHTNQHYSPNLDKVFFEELELPNPKYNLGAGSGSHAEETAKMLVGIEKILLKENPSIILVQGDTNTVLAGALAASKLNIPVGHVEAGLRSFDRRMPEELNRILTDHLSTDLFAPTKIAEKNLLNEGISKERVHLTGNTVVDAVFQNLEIAEKKSNVLKGLKLKKEGYFLVTCHRPSNVDKKARFGKLLMEFEKVGEKFDLPIIFPMHPRSKKMLELFKLEMPSAISAIDPVGYLEFLQLLKNAKLVLTDSGGIQEEACILKVPCITLRENTERPEAIEAGAGMLMSEDLAEDCGRMLDLRRNWENPFGDGKSAGRIIGHILKNA